ncbi:Transcription factor RLM1 [Nakaseomyces bracarensis]|uniref:Transcription factor RLM1 n=1 Tax=Nakaseomyces bracarensis TaxID=273131 RepID=A0ABR4P1E9_9SACH
MGRRKIEIEPITDTKTRGITFLKRKAGIFKKAHELSVLCGVDVAVVVLGTNGTFYEFSSVEMRELLRYYTDENGMGLTHVVTEPSQYGDYEKTATVKYQVSNGRRNRRGPKSRRVQSQSVDLKRNRSEHETEDNVDSNEVKLQKLSHARHNSTGTQLLLHQDEINASIYNNKRAVAEKTAQEEEPSNDNDREEDEDEEEDDDEEEEELQQEQDNDVKMVRTRSFPQVRNQEFYVGKENEQSAPKVVINSPPMAMRKDSAPSAYSFMRTAASTAHNNFNRNPTNGSGKKSKPVLKLNIPNSNIKTAERFPNQSVPSSPNHGNKDKIPTKNIITTPFQNFNYQGSPNGKGDIDNKRGTEAGNDSMRNSFSPTDKNQYMKMHFRPPFFGSFKNGNNNNYNPNYNNNNYNNNNQNANANGMVTGSPITNQYLATPLQQMNPNRITLYKGANNSNSGSTISNSTNTGNQNSSEVMTPGTGYLFAQKHLYGTLNTGNAQISNTRETSGKPHHYHNQHMQQQYNRNNDNEGNTEDENNELSNRNEQGNNTGNNNGKGGGRATTPIGPDTSTLPLKMNSDFLGNASSPNTSNMLFTDWNLASASNNFGGPNFLNSAGPKSGNIFGFMPLSGYPMGGQTVASNFNNGNNNWNSRNMELSPYLPHLQTPYPGKIFQFNSNDNNSDFPPSAEKQ